MLPTYRQNIIENIEYQITNIHKVAKAIAYNYELELKLK